MTVDPSWWHFFLWKWTFQLNHWNQITYSVHYENKEPNKLNLHLLSGKTLEFSFFIIKFEFKGFVFMFLYQKVHLKLQTFYHQVCVNTNFEELVLSGFILELNLLTLQNDGGILKSKSWHFPFIFFQILYGIYFEYYSPVGFKWKMVNFFQI